MLGEKNVKATFCEKGVRDRNIRAACGEESPAPPICSLREQSEVRMGVVSCPPKTFIVDP